MAMRQVSHLAYGVGASLIAGSSKTCAPYSSLAAWLITIFSTAARYSSGCCLRSAAVLTSSVVVSDIADAPRLEQGFGIERFEIRGEIGEVLGEFHRDQAVERLGRQLRQCRRHHARDRARLREQEYFATAYAEQLAGHGASRCGEPRYQARHVSGRDGHRTSLVDGLRIVGRTNRVRHARCGERSDGVAMNA